MLRFIRFLVYYATLPLMVAPLYYGDVRLEMGMSGYFLYAIVVFVVGWRANPYKKISKPSYSTKGRCGILSCALAHDASYVTASENEFSDIKMSFDDSSAKELDRLTSYANALYADNSNYESGIEADVHRWHE